MPGLYPNFLPLVVPKLPKLFLLFGDLTPNFASPGPPNMEVSPGSNMLWFYENDSILSATFSAVTKTTDTFNKNKRCHMNLEGLSSVCAKLEPASSKIKVPIMLMSLFFFTKTPCTLDHWAR